MRERLEITGSTYEPWDYAPWIRRVGGAVIDGVLTVAAQTPGSFGIGLMIIATTTTKRRDGSSSTQVTSHGLFNAGLTLAIVTYLIVLAFVIWNQILRPGRTGQSLGKQILGIRLLKETGEPLGAWLTCGRQLLHVLDSLPCFWAGCGHCGTEDARPSRTSWSRRSSSALHSNYLVMRWDNGREFIATSALAWLTEPGVESVHLAKGHPAAERARRAVQRCDT